MAEGAGGRKMSRISDVLGDEAPGQYDHARARWKAIGRLESM